MADRHAAQQDLVSLLAKFGDPDPDIRYMSLNDLLGILKNSNSAYLSHDLSSCSRLVDGLLKTLDDQNGEVQNQALKCIGPLVVRLPLDILSPFIDKLAQLTTSPTIDTSVPSTALRLIITALPRPQAGGIATAEASNAYAAISKVLIPRLVGPQGGKTAAQASWRGMLENDPTKGFSSDAIDVLIEVVKCYGVMLKDDELLVLQKTVMSIIENDNAGTVVTKRSLAAISALLPHLSDAQLSAFVSGLIESFRSSHLTLNLRRHLIATVSTLAKSAPSKFGPYLKTMAPFVLSAVSEQELDEMNEEDSDNGEHDAGEDELRETTLVTLEALIGFCNNDMLPYMNDAIDSALRYLKYDPNVAEVEDEEMGGTQDNGSDGGDDGLDEDDEFGDFEEEEGYSDIDDLSWKVRRSAAKLLYTLVSTRGSTRILEDGSLYEKVAPALISRMTKEREENVKMEVLVTLTGLVKRTSDGTPIHSSDGLAESISGSRNSRKRRRQDSDASMIDFEPAIGTSAAAGSPITLPSSPKSGPQAELARLVPAIVQGICKLWKRASVSLKHTGMALLKSLALVRYGGLADFLQQIEDPIADALKTSAAGVASSSSGTAAVTAGSLQIETLSLISAVAETHTSSALLPFLVALVPGVVEAVNDRNHKVSSEALAAVEQIVRALTPPRVTSGESEAASQLEKFYDVTVSRITDNSADLEVRHRAIHAFGVLLARTSGQPGVNFLSSDRRSKGLSILVDRLKNETTRLSVTRAIDDIALLAQDPADVTTEWISDVSAELGAQLRKSDRALRGACLEALKSLSMNKFTRAHFQQTTIQELANSLLPLLNADDLHLLTPALIIYAKVLPGNAKQLVTDSLITTLCSVVLAPLVGTVLKAYLLLVRVIGEQGAGARLMGCFLKEVGVNGDPSVVGKAIGTLLVHGGPDLGVTMQDFLRELETAQDNQRKCLALSILGEVGLRMGIDCPLTPILFMSHFESKSDKVRLSAAVALGSTGAGNIKTYLPVILDGLEDTKSSKYLLLHSLKEILQHPNNVRSEVAPFATRLWQILLRASDDEDNRVVGAECIGRLALIDPAAYIPMLQEYLSNSNSTIRGIVISAFRYTLANSSSAYNDALRPLIIPILVTMLADRDLGNHRLALTAVNSAIHNKMDIILPHLNDLLPAVMGDTHVKPELIREVQMGPFKHKVDDGLELRKSAYETLYACLDAAFPLINVSEFFERILAGIEDEQDIRIICNLMTSKLITLAPAETERHLDSLSEKYRTVLSFKLKDNAVKQELEKAQEASLGVLKISRELDKAFPAAEVSGDHHVWKAYMDWIRKDFATMLRNAGE